MITTIIITTIMMIMSIIFETNHDHAGADVVLDMRPLAHELVRGGTHVTQMVRLGPRLDPIWTPFGSPLDLIQ
jgi:hypothetical protein